MGPPLRILCGRFGCGCREGVVPFLDMEGDYIGLIHKDPDSD